MTQNSVLNFCIPSGLIEGSKNKTNEAEIKLMKRLVQFYQSEKKLHWIYKNTAVSSVKQSFKKPTCGLAAVSMAINMLETDTEERNYIEELLQLAINMKITKQGEMFSAENMSLLVGKKFKRKCKVVTFDKRTVISNLLDGKPILVPYDADSNYSPCCKTGHRSHWAVLTGVACGIPDELFCSMSNTDLSETLSNVNKIKENINVETDLAQKLLTSENIQVFAKHGNSSFLTIWSLDDLLKSNLNLTERRPDRNWDDLYCPFDLRKSLRGLAVKIF